MKEHLSTNNSKNDLNAKQDNVKVVDEKMNEIKKEINEEQVAAVAKTTEKNVLKTEENSAKKSSTTSVIDDRANEANALKERRKARQSAKSAGNDNTAASQKPEALDATKPINSDALSNHTSPTAESNKSSKRNHDAEKIKHFLKQSEITSVKNPAASDTIPNLKTNQNERTR